MDLAERLGIQSIVADYQQLVGKTVKAVAISEEPEFAIIGLNFKDGTIAWILEDYEGNGPGYLQIQPPPEKTKRSKK